MEYLKVLFQTNGLITVMGIQYFPSRLTVKEFYDLDQVAVIEATFLSIERNKEFEVSFSGPPDKVSSIIQKLRED